MQDKVYNLLVEQDDISWKTIIYDLVRSEEINPWDVDVSLLTQKYLDRLKSLKEADLKLSGKVLLAAAILLRIKSKRLVGEDLTEFDRLLAASEVTEEQFYDELEQELAHQKASQQEDQYELLPRLPQARKRKMSVYELVKALEKALEVKKRRLVNRIHDVNVVIPEKKFDITFALKSLYGKLTQMFNSGIKKIKFSSLIPTKNREDKIYTFIPLLHLANQKTIELEQEEPFGEINISSSIEVEKDDS